MIHRRRRFLQGAGAVATTAIALPRLASALNYPIRPVRLVVGFPPGGASDIVARLIAQSLSTDFTQQVIVENRPGAGTNIAASSVARAAPDGYTLLLASVANTVNATLYEKLDFEFMRDLVPIAGLVRGPLVMETHPSLPVRTLAEFIDYAKANAGKINMASAGNGTPGHMAVELFRMATGVKLVHVPYRGAAPALTDLLAGQVQAVFDNLPTSIEYIRAGSLRPLGVTTNKRVDALPDTPAVSELVPGYEVSSWFGVVAPRGTDPEVVDVLNRNINAALTNPAARAQFDQLGVEPLVLAAEAFGDFIAAETVKWAKVVSFSGAKPD